MNQIIKQERHILLVLNELCQQVIDSEGGVATEDEIDLLTVAHRLQESGMSVKQTQRCWELFRKRLRDVQKRESEFITATRQQLTNTFCEGQPQSFKARLAIYDSLLDSDETGQTALLGRVQERTRDLLRSYDGILTASKEGDEVVAAIGKAMKEC